MKIFKGILIFVIVPIIVSIIVGVWVFNYQYNNTVANERKDLANGFLNDM